MRRQFWFFSAFHDYCSNQFSNNQLPRRRHFPPKKNYTLSRFNTRALRNNVRSTYYARPSWLCLPRYTYRLYVSLSNFGCCSSLMLPIAHVAVRRTPSSDASLCIPAYLSIAPCRAFALFCLSLRNRIYLRVCLYAVAKQRSTLNVCVTTSRYSLSWTLAQAAAACLLHCTHGSNVATGRCLPGARRQPLGVARDNARASLLRSCVLRQPPSNV